MFLACMWTSTVMQEHYTVMSTWHDFCSEWPAFRYTLMSLLYSVTCCMNSTINTPFLPYQLCGRCLIRPFRLIWWNCVHPLLWLLFCFNIRKWNPGFIMLLERCDREIHPHLCGIDLEKSKPKEAFLCILCAPTAIFGTHVAHNLWEPSLLWSSRRDECVKCVKIHMNVLKLWLIT
jgi:hypothetical protein